MNKMVPSKTIGQNSGGAYKERSAIRVIVANTKGELLIIHAGKEDYFKIPGGRIEYDEDHLTVCEREVLELTGCKVVLDPELIATAEEWRDNIHQISFCYMAKLLEDTKSTAFRGEVEDSLKHQWAGIKESVKEMKDAKPTSEMGRSVKERDLFFVETYLEQFHRGSK